jgi:hypothetical protein
MAVLKQKCPSATTFAIKILWTIQACTTELGSLEASPLAPKLFTLAQVFLNRIQAQ